MKRGNGSVLAMRTRFVVAMACIVLVGSVIAAGLPVAPARGAQAVSSIADFWVPGSFPWGTAFDAAGGVWVAMPGCDPSPSCSSGTPPGQLAQYDPTSKSWSTAVTLPSGYGQPLFVEVDRAGKVWFTMPVTNAIGVYDPVNATVQQWPIPTASAGPWDLEIDSQGKIWFTEHFTNKIGVFDPTSQTFHEVSTPAANSNPYGITVDAANNVWFTENTDSVALIAEYTNGGVLNEFRIRNTPTGGTGLTPHLITLDRSGNLWWSEGWVSAIATLSLASAQPGTNSGVTEYHYTPPCGGCGSHTSGISVDSQGLIWFDDSGQNAFGSFPVGGGAFSFYNSPARHPHDGLRVDAQDRIWFDEEFSNRLGVAVQSDASTTTTTTPTPTTTTLPPPPGSVLGTDTFQRANQSQWGTASDGQSWGGDANASGAFSLFQNAGLVTMTGGNSYSAVLGPATTDAEVYATGSISSFNNSNFGDVLRFTDGNNWYKAYIDGQNLIIQKKVGGTTTILASTPFTATAGTYYTIHFRAVGSTLTANAWNTSGSEPGGWMLTAGDSTFASGSTGMRFLTQAGTLTITAYQARVPGSGSPPSTTTTTTTTTSTTTTPTTTTTTVPGSGTVLGTDTFQRPNQSRWGTASDGHTWGGDANTNAAFSVAGNAGLVTRTNGNSYSAVLGPSATNAEVYATGSLSSFANSNFGDVVRWTDGNNWYKAYVDGTSLVIQKKVNGSTTVLASVPFPANPATSYTVHFRALGATLTANAWAASSTEPTGWMLTANDTSLTSGNAGMRFLTQTGTLTATAFQARSV